MDENRAVRRSTWATFGTTLIALAIIVVLLIPPVKSWLNARPLIWRIAYPVLSVFALYGFVQSLRARDGVFTLLKWAVLLAAAILSSLWAYGLGGVFFTLGKYLALAFIVMELGSTAFEMMRTGKSST